MIIQRTGKIPDGMVVMRNRVLPTVTKREKLDIVKLTSKILSASVSYLKNYILKNHKERL